MQGLVVRKEYWRTVEAIKYSMGLTPQWFKRGLRWGETKLPAPKLMREYPIGYRPGTKHTLFTITLDKDWYSGVAIDVVKKWLNENE